LSLFWKKKSKDSDEGKLFKAPPADRGAFRVYPSKENPVTIKVGDAKLIAIDISAGGISFGNENFNIGATYPLEIILPEKETITVETTIHKIDDKSVCRCYSGVERISGGSNSFLYSGPPKRGNGPK